MSQTPTPPSEPSDAFFVAGDLREFIRTNRDEILARARSRVRGRNAPVATETELTQALPSFLDQLGEALRKASAAEKIDHAEITSTATAHGGQRFHQGLTVGQVVHDYGDLCQVITGLAVERKIALSVDDFRTLNLCLDDAIAGAVTSFTHHREHALAGEGTERLGVLAHASSRSRHDASALEDELRICPQGPRPDLQHPLRGGQAHPVFVHVERSLDGEGGLRALVDGGGARTALRRHRCCTISTTHGTVALAE